MRRNLKQGDNHRLGKQMNQHRVVQTLVRQQTHAKLIEADRLQVLEQEPIVEQPVSIVEPIVEQIQEQESKFKQDDHWIKPQFKISKSKSLNDSGWNFNRDNI